MKKTLVLFIALFLLSQSTIAFERLTCRPTDQHKAQAKILSMDIDFGDIVEEDTFYTHSYTQKVTAWVHPVSQWPRQYDGTHFHFSGVTRAGRTIEGRINLGDQYKITYRYTSFDDVGGELPKEIPFRYFLHTVDLSGEHSQIELVCNE